MEFSQPWCSAKRTSLCKQALNSLLMFALIDSLPPSHSSTRYIPGIWATLACQFLMIVLLAVNTYVFYNRNKLAREGKRINEGREGFYYTL